MFLTAILRDVDSPGRILIYLEDSILFLSGSYSSSFCSLAISFYKFMFFVFNFMFSLVRWLFKSALQYAYSLASGYLAALLPYPRSCCLIAICSRERCFLGPFVFCMSRDVPFFVELGQRNAFFGGFGLYADGYTKMG